MPARADQEFALLLLVHDVGRDRIQNVHRGFNTVNHRRAGGIGNGQHRATREAGHAKASQKQEGKFHKLTLKMQKTTLLWTILG